MKLLFVVRTDVFAGDGSQRVFGAFDLEEREKADQLREMLRNTMRGTYEVFVGEKAD